MFPDYLSLFMAMPQLVYKTKTKQTEINYYLRQKHYNLRNFNVFATDNTRDKYLLNSSAYQANQLWQTLPSKIKGCASLRLFKDKIKTWRCYRCQCQIFSRYIANADYI